MINKHRIPKPIHLLRVYLESCKRWDSQRGRDNEKKLEGVLFSLQHLVNVCLPRTDNPFWEKHLSDIYEAYRIEGSCLTRLVTVETYLYEGLKASLSRSLIALRPTCRSEDT